MDKEWQDLILSKVEKIEDAQTSMMEMLHIHTLDSVRQNAEIEKNHYALKDKVNILWGAVIFVVGTFLTAFIGKKL